MSTGGGSSETPVPSDANTGCAFASGSTTQVTSVFTNVVRREDEPRDSPADAKVARHGPAESQDAMQRARGRRARAGRAASDADVCVDIASVARGRYACHHK